jgi:hypothetical protein
VTSAPLTYIDVTEHPTEGRAVLRFSARPAPGGPPVHFIEYRLGQGRWRRGDEVEVRRRGVFSRVAVRAVDTAGAVGPDQHWEKNWPGLYAAEVFQGSGNWIGTYDWWKFRHHDRWWLDHPVCLLFRAGLPRRNRPEPALVPRIELVLRRLGLRSHLFDWVQALNRASDGGLALSRNGPPDVWMPTVCSRGLKRRLYHRSLPLTVVEAALCGRSAGLQNSLHMRVYAPGRGCFHHPEHGSWAVATCHVDVNELMTLHEGRVRWGAGSPPGAPDPGLGADLVKYGGNSEWAATRVADVWERAFGSRSVARAALPIGEPQDWFQVQGSGTWRDRSWVVGKWWRSDGRLTVLDLPPTE